MQGQDFMGYRMEEVLVAPFDPSDLASHIFQWDVSDSSTWDLNDSSDITDLRDKSGNGFDLDQITAADQPALITAGQNGLDIARFDGVTDYLIRTASAPAFTALTIFMAIKVVTYVNSEGLISFAANATNDWNDEDGIVLNGAGIDDLRLDRRIGADQLRVDLANVTAGNTWQLLEVHLDGIGTAGTIVSNGSQSATDSYSDLNEINPGRVVVSARALAGSITNFGENDIGEINGFNADLSGGDLTNMRDYMNDKWNLF